MKFSSALPLFASFSTAAGFVAQPLARSSSSSTPALASARADLESLAKELNPVVGYYDPLKLAEYDLYAQEEDAVIGFLRQSEIKHSRVAMAAFVGYCVQSNIHFPWPMTLAGEGFPDASLAPEAQWDALPLVAKLQIIGFVGLLEIYDETGGFGEKAHYMRGGQPGKFPTKAGFADAVHPIPLNLYDPFGFSAKRSEEDKKKGLVTEINNGRLAMIGIFGFIAADKVPGSVPVLDNIARSYDGQAMAPFTDAEYTQNIGSAILISSIMAIFAGAKTASDRNSEGVSAAPAAAPATGSLEKEIVEYDAAAKLAWDGTGDYEAFKEKYNAETVAMTAEKWAKKQASLKK